jgi:hypothetical protein
MPWTKKQRQIAGMACRDAGIDDAARKLLLRQLPNAMFNAGGVPVGDPSSTSPRLSQADFERFMAVIEDRAGGKLLNYSAHYWQDKAGSRSTVANERMTTKIMSLYREYESQECGGLDGHGIYGLDGLVRRFSNQRTAVIEELQPKEAWNLIEMLKAVIARRGSSKPDARPQQRRLFSDCEPEAHRPRQTARSIAIADVGGDVDSLGDDEIPF